MSTASSVTAQLHTLIAQAQQATHSDTANMTGLVVELIAGYGSDGTLLDNIEIFVADYSAVEEITVTAGVVDVYKRLLVS